MSYGGELPTPYHVKSTLHASTSSFHTWTVMPWCIIIEFQMPAPLRNCLPHSILATVYKCESYSYLQGRTQGTLLANLGTLCELLFQNSCRIKNTSIISVATKVMDLTSKIYSYSIHTYVSLLIIVFYFEHKTTQESSFLKLRKYFTQSKRKEQA